MSLVNSGLEGIQAGEHLKGMIETRDFTIALQQIVAIPEGSIYGYESLIQLPSGGYFKSLLKLSKIAPEIGLLHPEKAIREEAFRAYGSIKQDERLFININPRSFDDPLFASDETGHAFDQYKLKPQDIVFQVNPGRAINKYPNYIRVLVYYRSQGFLVAVDGFGAGSPSLETIAGLRPDFIKLDMLLVREALTKPAISALTETFLGFAQKLDARVIAEGVESEDELLSLARLGVTLVQGPFLANPAYPPSTLTNEANRVLQDLQRQFDSRKKRTVTVNSIATRGICVDAANLTGQVVSLFEHDQQLQGIVVIQQGKPLGLIMRNKLNAKLGTRFGFDLYMRRPVTHVMDSDPLIIDSNTSIEIASNLAMSRDHAKIYDDMILTESDAYYGIVSIQNLLNTITRSQLELAKAANPLTNLPGNPVIQGEITDRLESSEKFAVIYCDLDNFKAYNDYYGFERGDQVLSKVANILQKVVDSRGSGETFLGHIGGDDFVIITTPEKAEQLCQDTIAIFDAEIPLLYREEDRSSGYILTLDRMGTNRQFPLMSISLAIVASEHWQFTSHLEMAETAAELKKYVKSKPGSNYAWDRRNSVQKQYTLHQRVQI